MTRLRIEPRSPGPLAITILTRPMCGIQEATIPFLTPAYKKCMVTRKNKTDKILEINVFIVKLAELMLLRTG